MPARKKEKRPRVRVRMYRQGLGDCFLVTFYTGKTPVHALIDCGTLGATTTGVKMADVVAHIAAETGSRLDLLIATHEHRDHVSGFASERAAFDQIKVDHVWLAWTEDPGDPLALEIEKYKGDVLTTVGAALRAFDTDPGPHGDGREVLKDVGSGVRELLGFFDGPPAAGAPLGLALATGVNEAMSYVRDKAGQAVRFLSPGTLLEEGWLPGVRVYVLGPPRSKDALKNLGDHGSAELYGALGASIPFGVSDKTYEEYRAGLESDAADEFQQGLPFEPRFRVEQANQKACGERFARYYDPGEAWRRIDLDWLNGTSDLALQLDSLTNNTSLALAVELVGDGTVLLFAADAQVGNWLSWHEHTWKAGGAEVKAADLLGRAVFYKVGHHSSHNATINEKGLELMTRDALMAAIPVDRKVALNKTPKWMMPADALYARLVEKTRGRVVRSDTGWPDARPESIPQAEWDAARKQAPIDIQPMYVDFNIW
jgi:hypothetical protein